MTASVAVAGKRVRHGSVGYRPPMISLADIEAAAARISPYIHRTPLYRNKTLSQRSGTNVYLKMELFQKTGSFKPRGAFNQLMALHDESGADRFVGVSGGNFAQGFAYAAWELGLEATVVMAETTPAHYIAATTGYGASVELVPDIAAAFERSKALADGGRVEAHPFDNPAMMAGNGSLGLEIVEDLSELTDVYISVGGGGLITGVGSAILARRPGVRIHAVETDGTQVLVDSIAAGGPLKMTPTSVSRTLGAPYLSETAYEFARAHISEAVVVSDASAYRALIELLERAKVVAEIAASCTLAAFERDADRFGSDDHVVLVLCGGNVSADDLANYRERFAT